jgi:hypothetical protein
VAEAVGYRKDASRKDEQGQGGVSTDKKACESPKSDRLNMHIERQNWTQEGQMHEYWQVPRVHFIHHTLI